MGWALVLRKWIIWITENKVTYHTTSVNFPHHPLWVSVCSSQVPAVQWCHLQLPAGLTPVLAERPLHWGSDRAFHWREPPERSAALNLRGEQRQVSTGSVSKYQAVHYYKPQDTSTRNPLSTTLLTLLNRNVVQHVIIRHTCVGIDTVVGFYHDEACVSGARSGCQAGGGGGRGGWEGGGAGSNSCSQSDRQSGGVVPPWFPLKTQTHF